VVLFLSLYFKALKYTIKESEKIEKAKDKKGKLYEKGYCWFLNSLYLASQFSWILMSLSITAHENSNSTHVGTGADLGFNAQEHTNKTLTTSPFGNTCEVDEVSPEVEVGVVAELRCLQP
jgi:hypothetical protein